MALAIKTIASLSAALAIGSSGSAFAGHKDIQHAIYRITAPMQKMQLVQLKMSTELSSMPKAKAFRPNDKAEPLKLKMSEDLKPREERKERANSRPIT